MNAISKRFKPFAHGTSWAWGRVTAELRLEPRLLIAGGQRCGTTSMYRALSQHPGILKPVLRKGVHYFDVAYDRDMAWYRSHFPLKATAKFASRRVGHDPLTFESSPYYLFHPLAPRRIGTDLPGVKVIVLVRDPAERAYSAHAHELARGFETEPFERALALEEERLLGEEARLIVQPSYQSHAHRHQAYVRRGEYATQLQRMADEVGRDNVFVVDSQQFFTDPDVIFRRVMRFLGLPWVPSITFDRHNARGRSPMSDGMRTHLDDHFLPHDMLLMPWLGATPSWRT